MTVYLDCNATTPLEPEIAALLQRFLTEEYGNAGSRTHEFGNRAKQAVQRAREQVARAAACREEEVVFTSGATEANNIAILGLAAHGEATGKRHIVTTGIEHKATLEPVQHLTTRGFTATVVSPGADGWIDPAAIRSALRPDTLLVSVMHVNNETGIRQPLKEIAAVLPDKGAFFHVDAAQGFGKDPSLRDIARIDLLSLSAHKLYGPKGIGALITRRRGYDKIPLTPLQYGGGQERGLRPGTLPVHLIVALGECAERAVKHHAARTKKCSAFRERLLAALLPAGAVPNGDQSRCVPHTVSLAFPGLDSEALMLAWKGTVACSNGSACTSSSYQPSHVLKAMDLPEETVRGTVRLSWCHLTEEPDWAELASAVGALRE